MACIIIGRDSRDYACCSPRVGKAHDVQPAQFDVACSKPSGVTNDVPRRDAHIENTVGRGTWLVGDTTVFQPFGIRDNRGHILEKSQLRVE